MYEERTVPGTPNRLGLVLPDRFRRLRPEQQAGALASLQRLTAQQRQSVLDEWAARCNSSSIRNPAGYLFGIIQRALRGEFRAWACRSGGTLPPSTAPSEASTSTTSPGAAARAQVQQHIAELREMLNIGPSRATARSTRRTDPSA